MKCMNHSESGLAKYNEPTDIQRNISDTASIIRE